jgi:hypothetical protein
MRRFMLSTLALFALASPAAAQERICQSPGTAEFLFNDPRDEKKSNYIAENCKTGDALFLSADNIRLMLRHCDLARTVHFQDRQRLGWVMCSIHHPPRTEIMPPPSPPPSSPPPG